MAEVIPVFLNSFAPYLLVFLISFLSSFVLVKLLIPRLKREGMVGKDENKPGAPEIAEMGGIGIIAGFTAGILLAIFMDTFFGIELDLIYLLVTIITAHSIAFIGMVDDMFGIPQRVKALLPLFAAIPLVAVKAGTTLMIIPFFGPVQLGIIYVLVLVPLAISVCSNLTNMLAGFNGLEAGLGIIMFGTLFLVAFSHGSLNVAIISLAMFAALMGFFIFNHYPASVFPGDVGNLSIGVVFATTIIIGSFESAGIILMLPYIVDFFIKAINGFPHTHQDLRNGKLYPKDGKVKGLVHVIMKLFGGLSEKRLVIVFLAIEGLIGLIVLIMYFKI